MLKVLCSVLTLFISTPLVLAGSDERPSPRSGFSMAYDTNRNVLVLHGGIVPEGRLQDTWEWDGSGWKLVSTEGPGALSDHALAYDEARSIVVLFGGNDANRNLNGSTWGWDGSSWRELASAGPPPRNLFEMDYDPVRQRIVLFGGSGQDRVKLNDTWEWDGSTWAQAGADGPSQRSSFAMAFDPALGEMIITGGSGPGSTEKLWSWNGERWLEHDNSPPARLHHSMAYDAGRRRMVLFGGFGKNGRSPDLFELTDGIWTKIDSTGPDPGPRAEHEIVYVPGRGVLLFGGITGQLMAFEERERMNDLWLWDGSVWKKLD